MSTMHSNSRQFLRQIPNTLTVLRVLLAVLFPLSPESWRLAIVLVALATEYLDGVIARRFEFQTQLGRLLDPVADKLFFASVALTFLAEGRLGKWELVLLALRDIAVLVALAWLVARRQWKPLVDLRPGMAGKLTTVLQYGALFWLLFRTELHPALVLLTAVAGALAIAQYFHTLGSRIGNGRTPS